MASFAEIHQSTTFNSGYPIFEQGTIGIDEEHIFKIEYGKYVENKIVFECLLNCIDDLDPEVGNKLEDIINDIKLKQYLKLENQNLLGLTVKNRELSYQEADLLKSVLRKKLLEKKKKVFQEFKKITSKDLDLILKQLKPSPTLPIVIEYKDKLFKEQELFMINVKRRNKILDEMLDIRLRKVPTMCNQTIGYCKAIIESNSLKTKLAEYKMKLDVFKEIPKAIEAYQVLLKDIKQQQEECELSIEKMKDLKIKYENVKGREYDEILRSYLMYKHSIEDMNKIYGNIK
ncbi:uncharacterized protein LOC123678837 [Harmonia axyridis]|uniref:uncharacterized protein LOC123678837 n=1 Tax=Harmonia axyridis TaxID=115357 RepID=UPI001E278B6A|nr:uncharacterized protein LOC123678837 [Harmonia axyridis]